MSQIEAALYKPHLDNLLHPLRPASDIATATRRRIPSICDISLSASPWMKVIRTSHALCALSAL
jgi:hypothetical protein